MSSRCARAMAASALAIAALSLVWASGVGAAGGTVGDVAAPMDVAQEAVDRELSSLDLRSIEEFVAEIDRDMAEHMPRFDIREIISNHGSGLFDAGRLARDAASLLLGEVKLNLRLLGELIVIAVVCALLTVLGDGLGGEGPAAVAWSVCYMVIVAIGVNAFSLASHIATGAVDQMMSFMYAMIPSLTALLAASGGIASAAVVSPMMLAATSAVATVVKSTVIPLLLLAATLTLVGDISGRKQVSRLAGLLRSWSLTVLGLVSTVFVAAAGVRGGLASVSDAAAAKAAKFLSGSMIPVVGKVFGDAIDLVATSSMMIRGALGAFGLAALAVVCLHPVIKIAAIMFLFRAGAAITQPLGDARVSDCLSELANSITSLCVSVATVGLMFFICISLMIGLGGVIAAVR
ncbi:MAG: stage III sporulation protein AE [Clostridia bacterium]|nr:stage III sporulation protein AE [Clostridia bacterium]